MSEYRNNSDRRKNEPPAALDEGIRKRKKNPIKQAMGIGNISRVGDYAVKDVIIPSIRRTIIDIVSNGIRMLLDDRGQARMRDDDFGRRDNYRAYYADRSESKVNSRNDMDNFDDFEFASAGKAKYILTKLQDYCYQQNYCEVARLFSECNDRIPSSSYWDYGWVNLDDVEIIQQSNGWWIIDLPPARFIANRRRQY